MEKIINKLIDLSVKGCDVYHHKGSTWLIFTYTKQWVIELTEDRTLWYNYNIFNSLFSYASMEVVENENYITKWVENNIINGIQDINYMKFYPNALIKNVVEKGIQEPLRVQDLTEGEVEEVIEFGVKETTPSGYLGSIEMNGKIVHQIESPKQNNEVDDVIDNGIKKTGTRNLEQFGVGYSLWKSETVIKEGIKETKSMDGWVNTPRIVGDVVENGVKKTKTPNKDGDIQTTLEWMYDNNSDVCDVPKMIDNVIENGVKHTESNPFDFKDVIEDVVQNGVNKTHGVSKNLFWEIGDTIQNGIKKTISRENPSTMVDDIIKKTKADASQNPMGKVTEVLRDGKVSK